MSDDCIFCSIAAGTTPADVVYESEQTLFLRDINPKARIHLLAIPREHISSVAAVQPVHEAVVGQLIREIGEVARQQGIHESGFRVIANTGPDSGMDVKHLHFHILGGQNLGPLVSP